MPNHSPSGLSPAEVVHEVVGADEKFAWLPMLAKAEDTEEESARYSSPPCFLAEFPDADLTDSPAK